jgi:hypothetical protein
VREDAITIVIEALKGKDATVFVAPSEAEWQCVAFELWGVTDGTISIDSDIYPLGSKLMVLELGWDGKCCIVHRHNAHKSESLGSGEWDEDAVALHCALLGCDYVKRPYLQGNDKVLKIMKKCTSAEMVNTELYNIETRGRYGKDKPQGIPGYAFRALRAKNLFLYAPVFKTMNDEGMVTISSPTSVIITSIRSRDGIARSWGEDIGFDALSLLPDSIQNLDVALGRINPKSGQPWKLIPNPKDVNGIEYAPGAIIDFSLHPIVQNYPESVLVNWLIARNVPPKTGATLSEYH